MKKLVTLLVALAMVLTLGTAAMAAEGDGSEANPYVIDNETISVTIPAGGTVYVKVDATEAPKTLTVDGGRMYWEWYLQIGVQTCNPYPNGAYQAEIPEGEIVVAIVNSSAESDAVLNVTVAGIESGTMDKPQILEGEFMYEDVALAEGDGDGYFYQWTAVADGSVELQMYSVTPEEGVEADIVVTNQNTGAQRSLLADGAANEYGETVLKLDVSEGDVLAIQVVVVPDANWNIPAAEISWSAVFSYPLGTELNPVMLEPEWNAEWTEASLTFSVPVGTTYYAVRAGGMMMSINGGEPFLVPNMMGMPYSFPITNDGEAEVEYTIHMYYPVGSMSRPEIVESGSHKVSFAEGSEPYYMSWIAEADGEVVISIESTTGWFYVVNNMTSYSYGDNHYSDDDPAVSSETITVAAGDEIQIVFNAYDPANMWASPAGDVTISIAYAGSDSDETGDMIGVVVAMLAVSGMGITVLKKKEF